MLTALLWTAISGNAETLTCPGKDLLGLVPGMTLAQWVGGRLAAQGIRGVVRAGSALFRSPPQDEEAGFRSEPGPPPSKSARRNMRTAFTISPQ